MKRFINLSFLLVFLITLANPSVIPTHAAEEMPSATVDASITVNSTADTQANEGACTLREAILNANADDQSGSTDCAAGDGADTISFDLPYPATITIIALTGLPAVSDDLTIQGAGADLLSVSGGGTARILIVNSGVSLTVDGLALINARGSNGGAIDNSGNLSVSNSAFIDNTTPAVGGAIYNSEGTVVVNASAFYSNEANNAGGAIANASGTMTVTNSTFVGNLAVSGAWGGGAIYSYRSTSNAATLTVTASTFADNSAPAGGGAIGNGGGSSPGGTATIQNTVMADNMVGVNTVNCYNQGGTLIDGGYNIEDADTCGFSGTSLPNTDPMFLDLDDYGPTPFVPLHSNGPAVDYIPSGENGCGTTLVTDQRGVARPLDGNGDGTLACDVGAYESDQQVGPAFVVNLHDDTDGLCTIISCTLRQAINAVELYPPGTAYTITFDLTYPDTIVLGSQLPLIIRTLTILGPGADLLAVSGDSSVRILRVDSGAHFTIDSLALINGYGANGGAIYNEGNLKVLNSTFRNNLSSASSGAIFNAWASLEVTASAFMGNRASTAGGAIGNDGGSTSVSNSTFFENSASGFWGGGAIYNFDAILSDALLPGGTTGDLSPIPEGAASPNAATLVVTASTFYRNMALTGGGAIDNENGSTATLQNTVLAGNTAGGYHVNCYNGDGTLTDGGYNIEGADTCGFSGTSLANTDPMFLELDDYGPTPFMPLHSTSPAIDFIPSGENGCGTTLVTDQRGVARPLDGDGDATPACDVGAYEFDQQLGPAFIVNLHDDTDGLCTISACTLRQAINTVQLYPPGTAYTITFDLPYPDTIVLGSGLPVITSTLTIQGPGADRLSVSGDHSVRALTVAAEASLTVDGLTFLDGVAANGGALINYGSVNVSNSVFANNSSTSSGGAIANGGGTLVVNTSTFFSNQAGTAGGAIGNYGGPATVTNSTFYGNSAIGSWGGGAIYNHFYAYSIAEASDVLLSIPEGTASPNDAALVVMASTFYNNTAPGGGGAIGNGGGSEIGGAVILQNTAMAANMVDGISVNCYNGDGTLTDGGYNIEDANTCGFSGTSLINTDPLFRDLANYGGSTPTVALHSNSPAIDHIPVGVSGCGTTLINDQRGVIRPQGDGCDVGAFEYFFKLYLPLIARAVPPVK